VVFTSLQVHSIHPPDNPTFFSKTKEKKRTSTLKKKYTSSTKHQHVFNVRLQRPIQEIANPSSPQTSAKSSSTYAVNTNLTTSNAHMP
jgi:hypothetical protein